MRIFLILSILIASITSVFASDFSWSRANHNRLNGFIRSTKLPPGQYLIGVYSTGNTITEYVPEVIVVEKPRELVTPQVTEPMDLGGTLAPVINTLDYPVGTTPSKEYMMEKCRTTRSECIFYIFNP